MSEGCQIIDEYKQRLSQIGKKHNLDLMILYGSFAKGKTSPESDVDIAIYKKDGFDPKEYGKIYAEIMQTLRGFEVDVKSLNNANPLFKFFVTNDGVLLFGNSLLFAEIKAASYQDYFDSQSLFELEKILSRKAITNLLNHYA